MVARRSGDSVRPPLQLSCALSSCRGRALQPIRTLLTVVLAASALPSHAADWSLCPAMPAAPTADIPAPAEPGATRATADRMTADGPDTVLMGDVTVRRQTRTVHGDRIELDRDTDRATARGGVWLEQDGLFIEGDNGEVNLDTGAFELDTIRYSVQPAHAQGRASRVRRDAAGITHLTAATFSTCPPGTPGWHLQADEIELDPQTGQGTAHGATLEFKGVPLLYTPWLRFPLGDERRSGLLTPSFGSNSSSGTTIGIPYYWNAAPNFDATIEPRYLSERGGQLRSEWRWLGPAGFWKLDNEHLPGDDKFGADRTLTRIEHSGRFGAWRTSIDAADASDDEYFEDLSTRLDLSSQTNLRQRAQAHWSGTPGDLRLRYQDFQSLSGGEPFSQVPQIELTGRQDYGRFELDYRSELVRFERSDSDEGTRLNLRPELTWNLERPGWFLRPSVGWDYTAYDLDRTNSTGPSGPDRSLPLLSLDTGLIFERFGSSYRQTLEPRAFYVYVPEESQDDLPVFDTSEFEFSSAQLFRARRFNGPDRLGDANRLTLAVTTRLFDRASGRERLSASLGAIHFFDDRKVQLPSEPIATDEQSDLALELAARPTERWSSRLFVQWDADDDRTEESTLDLRYKADREHQVNFSYRFARDGSEIANLGAAWRLSPHWMAVGSTRRSLDNEDNLETILGAEYASCCWQARVVARDYLGGQGEQETGISVELVLKGLGGLGDDAGGLFQRAILGRDG